MKCSFSKIPAIKERYLQQNFRFNPDESLNSADDSPQLLNALSSSWGIAMQIDQGSSFSDMIQNFLPLSRIFKQK
jgi:hypothetical protein